MSLDVFLDYFRLVGYGIIILASLRGIAYRNFNNMLFVGDIVMAFALLVSTMIVSLFDFWSPLARDMILTPAVILWALVHFHNMLIAPN